jgi:hypothetical protein
LLSSIDLPIQPLTPLFAQGSSMGIGAAVHRRGGCAGGDLDGEGELNSPAAAGVRCRQSSVEPVILIGLMSHLGTLDNCDSDCGRWRSGARRFASASRLPERFMILCRSASDEQLVSLNAILD